MMMTCHGHAECAVGGRRLMSLMDRTPIFGPKHKWASLGDRIDM